MNLNKKLSSKEQQFFIKDPTIATQLSNQLLSWIPKHINEIIVVCIGSDRSTGDSLGPLVGSFIQEKDCKHLSVYGTLEDPVHAINLKQKLTEINTNHNYPFIIAIDACLGKSTSIGSIYTSEGPVKPGAALKKDLPPVGNLHISGVVNVGGYMEYFVLQNTRLHTVVTMAKKIATALHHLDRQLLLRHIQKQKSSKNLAT